MQMVTALALVLPVVLAGAAAATPVAPKGQVARPTVQPPLVGEPHTVAAVFRQFGLIGTWAVDCSQPAAPDNPHVSDMELSPGIVLERQDLGPGNQVNSYTILQAKRLSKTEVALEVIFQPGQEGEQRQHLVMRVVDDTRRTLFNQVVGGPVRVKNGVALAYGLKTPTLGKCE